MKISIKHVVLNNQQCENLACFCQAVKPGWTLWTCRRLCLSDSRTAKRLPTNKEDKRESQKSKRGHVFWYTPDWRIGHSRYNCSPKHSRMSDRSGTKRRTTPSIITTNLFQFFFVRHQLYFWSKIFVPIFFAYGCCEFYIPIPFFEKKEQILFQSHICGRKKFPFRSYLTWRITAVFPAPNAAIGVGINRLMNAEARRQIVMPSGQCGQSHQIRRCAMIATPDFPSEPEYTNKWFLNTVSAEINSPGA